MRVAIIGAGAAGLASARHVTVEGIECEILEMASELGGTWIYYDDSGKDQYGFPIYSAMYKDLRTNLPKEVMNYPDFYFPEQERSYLTQPKVLDFLNQYADHFNLKRLIRFNRMVTDVRPFGDQWQIKSIDKPTKKEIVNIYDAVMVCNGHNNEPFIAKIPGEGNFKGKISHSRQYRSPEEYTDQRVLIIGGGPSGLDIVYLISSVAQHVVLSHHSELATLSKFPSNVTKKPDVSQIKDNGEVEFIDNSCERFDAIMYCTGYKYNYPFLHDTCGVTVDNNWVKPLYKHMINIDRPTMCFIGIPTYVCAFQLCDLQARFFCKYLKGTMSLPSSEDMRMEMDKDMQNRWAKGYSKKKAHYMGPDQQDYYDDLATTANITPIPPVIVKLWHECLKRIFDDIQNFREDDYKIIDNENFIRI